MDNRIMFDIRGVSERFSDEEKKEVNNLANELLKVIDNHSPKPWITVNSLVAVFVSLIAVGAKSRSSARIIIDEAAASIHKSVDCLDHETQTNWTDRAH